MQWLKSPWKILLLCLFMLLANVVRCSCKPKYCDTGCLLRIIQNFQKPTYLGFMALFFQFKSRMWERSRDLCAAVFYFALPMTLRALWLISIQRTNTPVLENQFPLAAWTPFWYSVEHMRALKWWYLCASIVTCPFLNFN